MGDLMIYSVLAERLHEAAYAVGRARHVLPADPAWQQWHEELWKIEHLLASAAEQVHADELQAQTEAQYHAHYVPSWRRAERFAR
jgi:hypothetical protein